MRNVNKKACGMKRIYFSLLLLALSIAGALYQFWYVSGKSDEFTKRIREISAKYPYIKAVEDGKILGYAYANTFKERKAYDLEEKNRKKKAMEEQKKKEKEDAKKYKEELKEKRFEYIDEIGVAHTNKEDIDYEEDFM